MISVGHGAYLDSDRILGIVPWETRARRMWKKTRGTAPTRRGEDLVRWNGTPRAIVLYQAQPEIIYIRVEITPETIKRRLEDAQRQSELA